jgi:CBS domain-containing protein
MRIDQVMTRGLEIVSPDMTVKEAAIRMAEADVGAILVGSQEGLCGILTTRDIIIRLVAEGRDPGAVSVGDVMSSTLFVCRENDSVEQAIAEMKKRQVRRLPVVDAANKPIGIVVLSDLSKHLSSADLEQLRRVVEPHRDMDGAHPDDSEAE